MRVTLEVMTGLLMGRRFDLRPGLPTVFGRSEKAEVCFAHDPEMADRQFQVECTDDACRLRALSPDVPTFVNGARVTDAVLEKGTKITAGRTTLFVVKTEGAASGSASSEPAPATAETSPPAPERTGPEFLAWLNLDEVAQALVAPAEEGPDLVKTLADAGNFPAAGRVQAHLLGPRKAVWWGILCLKSHFRDDVPPIDRRCLKAAETWVVDPTDEARRAAGDLAEEVEHEGTGVWLAMGVFWSGGSLAPAEFTAVPPDERLTGQAVTGALMLAAAEDPPHQKKNWTSWLSMAKDVEAGKLPLPTAPPRR